MKAGLVSLALLGSTARGCFLRGVAPTKAPTAFTGLRARADGWGVLDMEQAPSQRDAEDVLLPPFSGSLSVHFRRREGKRALKIACARDAKFGNCQTNKGMGSALKLAKCLSRGPALSDKCEEGLAQW